MTQTSHQGAHREATGREGANAKNWVAWDYGSPKPLKRGIRGCIGIHSGYIQTCKSFKNLAPFLGLP